MVAMAALLDFWSEQLRLFLMHKSPWCFLPTMVAILNFSYIWSTSQPDPAHQVSSQLAFQFRRKSSGERAKNWFSRFQIGKILAIFDLEVTPMLSTKFQVNWSFGSGEEAKSRFSRWPPWWPSWISDRNDFSYFWSKSHPDASYQVLSQLAFLFKRRGDRFSRWRPSWISDQNTFRYFWSTSHLDASYQVNWPTGEEE